MSNKKILSKRIIPDLKLKIWRKNFLFEIGTMNPIKPEKKIIYIEKGNSKVGYKNHEYYKTWVWNLPPIIACPQASEWCRESCYNADNREEVFPINKWMENYYLAVNYLETVKNQIIETLKKDEHRKIAFRIHSSGDFISNKYIRMWLNIVKECRHVDFWTYTRSWEDDKLIGDLILLREEENIQVFASWDKTMKALPSGWRKSVVYEPEEILELDNGIICPEQSGSIESCIDCKFCLKNRSKNVFFILH
ncbi:MAG: hypothetical protein FE834_03905 [Gammaproteobacteria bacterium]|nr:hypothetical protein [Gammaproteobacteria bacterium]